MTMTPGRFLDIVRLRLRTLFRRARVERDLDRELALHLDLQIQENLERGLSPDEAHAAALRSLGGITQIRDACHDTRRTQQLDTIWQDLRYAVRAMRRAPGFTALIVLTLALAVGANSAVFSVIQGVLLRPLPYAQPDRLVRVYFQSDVQAKFPLNPNDFLDFRARTRLFDGLAAMTRKDPQLSGAGEPVMLQGFRVSAGYFHVLGLSPARGREFTADDERPGGGRLAILSDRLWRTRFAADPNIVGRTITLDARTVTIVGVMSPQTRHPGNNFHAVADGDTVDLWMPYTFDDDPTRRYGHFMDVIGRLRPGVSVDQGNADLRAVLDRLANEHTGRGWRVYLVPLYQELVGRSQRMLFVLLGAVGLLLLIACVNAASLLLARSSARVREIAVRAALGAGRARIIRQLLTESLLIALAGAAGGTLLAAGGVRALVALLPASFPRAAEIHLDTTVFAFTLLIAVLTGLLFGLAPALSASRLDLQHGLREGGRGAIGAGRQMRLQHRLVAGQTALACVLLIAAGLLLHSFVNLLRADPGFRPQQVLTAAVFLPAERYHDPREYLRFYGRLIAELQALPGVRAAGIGTDLPWTGYDGNADGFTVEGQAPSRDRPTMGRYHVASAGYFEALGIPLLRGRVFTDRDDDPKALPVMLINESMAARYWPNEDALGKRITFSSAPKEQDWITVVGVIRDIKDTPDSRAVRPGFWLPPSQGPERGMWLALRGSMDAGAMDAGPRDANNLAIQLRRVVADLDPTLAIGNVRVMNQVAEAATAGQRFALLLVGIFAALALVLATIGMYGVVSYSVNQRLHEFGLRMALGATRGQVLRLILGQGLKLSIAGTAIGLLCAAVMARLIESLLYDVGGTDPVTFAAVGVLALITSTLACYRPAWRATQADPMRALRAD